MYIHIQGGQLRRVASPGALDHSQDIPTGRKMFQHHLIFGAPIKRKLPSVCLSVCFYWAFGVHEPMVLCNSSDMKLVWEGCLGKVESNIPWYWTTGGQNGPKAANALRRAPCKRAGLDRLQWCKLRALFSRPESITEILSYISLHPPQDGDYDKVEIKCSLKCSICSFVTNKRYVHKSLFTFFFICFLLCRHSFQSII